MSEPRQSHEARHQTAPDGFGARLREARTRAGLSQASIADLFGIRPQQVWRWEAGRSTPDLMQLVRLAGLLNVTSTDLLGA